MLGALACELYSVYIMMYKIYYMCLTMCMLNQVVLEEPCIYPCSMMECTSFTDTVRTDPECRKVVAFVEVPGHTEECVRIILDTYYVNIRPVCRRVHKTASSDKLAIVSSPSGLQGLLAVLLTLNTCTA